MTFPTVLPGTNSSSRRPAVNDDRDPVPAESAVAWGAILAGAAAAAALSLILLMLGVGLGLSSVSPWFGSGIQASSFGVSTIVWLTVTQLLASALGGYLAGRLRTRWSGVHRDEVYFRDTAHGFLAWAVASLVTAALLTTAIASIVGGGVRTGVAVAGDVAVTTKAGESTGYFIDALFRRDAAGLASPSAADQAEVGRVFQHANQAPVLPADDVHYLGLVVAQRTGLQPPEAEKRVADIYSQTQAWVTTTESAARESADKARKASAYGLLWLFVALLIGAFVASLAATFGGSQRDA